MVSVNVLLSQTKCTVSVADIFCADNMSNVVFSLYKIKLPQIEDNWSAHALQIAVLFVLKRKKRIQCLTQKLLEKPPFCLHFIFSSSVQWHTCSSTQGVWFRFASLGLWSHAYLTKVFWRATLLLYGGGWAVVTAGFYCVLPIPRELRVADMILLKAIYPHSNLVE